MNNPEINNTLTENNSDDDKSNYSDNSDNDSIINDSDSDDDMRPPPPPADDDSDSDDDFRPSPPDDDETDNNYDNNLVNNENSTFDTISDDSDDDSTVSDDDEYLQKFNSQNRQNILQEFYPELHQHNIDEIKTLSMINRDENGNIIDQLHQTLPFITKYEKTRILGERSKQIAAGAAPLIPIDNTIIDSYLIAEKEFNEKAIPFIIKRPLPSGGSEYWKLEDLEILV